MNIYIRTKRCTRFLRVYMSESAATVRFIGHVKEREDQISVIELSEEYCLGLLGIEEYSHLIILYWMHLVDNEGQRGTLYCYPRRDRRSEPRGVFTCRNPSRPNPIGLTVVEFMELDGCKLRVKGLDAFEGSPIVDIKSYSPLSDAYSDAKIPDWSWDLKK